MPVIQAHSVPSSSLKEISELGKVLSPNVHPAGWLSNDRQFKLERIGINTASTFTGFCSTHDNALFAPLEKVQFEVSSTNALLLLYRATCREYFRKRAQAAMINSICEKSLHLRTIETQDGPRQVELDVEYALRATEEVDSAKGQLDMLVRENDVSSVKYLAIEFQRPPDIMCSGVTTPIRDFDGNLLQDYRDLDANLLPISLTLFCSFGQSYAVFSWLTASDEIAITFLRSLFRRGTDRSIASAIARFVIGSFENWFARPNWWDGLADCSLREFSTLHRLCLDMVDPRDPEYWAQDSGDTVEWALKDVKTNCPQQVFK